MDNIKTWLKLGDYFFSESNIRGMSRQGNKVLVKRNIGEDIVVDADYDRIKDILTEYFGDFKK